MSTIAVGQQNSAPVEACYEDRGSGDPVVLPTQGDDFDDEPPAAFTRIEEEAD
jgi:hypothetical protein